MVVHIHFVHLHTQEEHVPDSVLVGNKSIFFRGFLQKSDY